MINTREKMDRRNAFLRAKNRKAMAPCYSCGKPALIVDGEEQPRCKSCHRKWSRDTIIDPLLPWEKDLDAQALVTVKGAIPRPIVAILFGVSGEMIRLIEVAAMAKLAHAFETGGIDAQALQSWLSRDTGAHYSDLMGDE